MDNKVLLTQMAQLFIVIFLGYILGKAKIFTKEFNQKLTKLILDVTMPLMILNSVLTQNGEREYGKIVEIFGISIAIYIILPIIGLVLVKIIRIPLEQQGLYIFMHTYSNVGFMGFPIINALYGEKAVLYTAILNIVFNFSAYSIGVIMVNYGNDKSEKMELKHLLSPGIIGSVISVVLYFVPVHFPEVFTGAIGSVGSITSPLAMLLIGSNLADMRVKEIFNDWRVYVFAVLKQFVVPMLCWPIIRYAIADEFIRGVIFVLILMPVANTSVLFAIRYDKGEELATKNVFMTTVLSIITVPLAFVLIKYM